MHPLIAAAKKSGITVPAPSTLVRPGAATYGVGGKAAKITIVPSGYVSGSGTIGRGFTKQLYGFSYSGSSPVGRASVGGVVGGYSPSAIKSLFIRPGLTSITDPTTGYVAGEGTKRYREILAKMGRLMGDAAARQAALNIKAPSPVLSPLGFDVKATQPHVISKEVLARSRAEQLAIGGSVALGAGVIGLPLAAGVGLPVLAGRLLGGAAVSAGAQIAAEPSIRRIGAGKITVFDKARWPPSVDVPATVGFLGEEFAGTTVRGRKRLETSQEVVAKQNFVRGIVGIVGFAAGARVGGGAVQGLQTFLTRFNPKALLTTNPVLTGGKQFASGGKGKIIILVKKGSAIETAKGKIIPVTNRGIVISQKTGGRFISAGSRQGLPTASRETGLVPSGFGLTPTPRTLPPVVSPLAAGKVKPLDFSILGTSKRALTAAEAIAATKAIRRVSPKAGAFDIFGIPIPKEPIVKRPATTLEALKFAKGVRKVSPKPGLFDAFGRPIETGVPPLRKPATTLEALEFGKSIRKVSPKPGIFTFSGIEVSEKFGIPKKPLTAKQAIEETKDIRRVKIKKGSFRQPRTFKEVFRIERPAKPTRFTSLKRTVTVQREAVKPRFVPGSFTSLAQTLPRVAKTPTQSLFEREMFEIAGVKPAPPKAAGLFGEPAKSVFQPPRLTSFERQIRGEVGKQVGGRRRFADVLGLSIFQRGRERRLVRGRERISPIEAFVISPKEGFIDLQKPLVRPIIRRATSIIDIPREIPREKIKPAQRPLLRPIQRPIIIPKFAVLPKEIIKEKEKITPRTKTPGLVSLRLTRQKQPKGVSGFQVFVRGKGRKTRAGWQPGNFVPAATGVLPQKKALAFGQSLVAGTAKQTFRIEPAFGKPARVGKIPSFKAEMFRRGKKGSFIERQAYLIDRPGEVRAIPLAGQAALRAKRARGISTRKRKKPKKKTRAKRRRRAFAKFGVSL